MSHEWGNYPEDFTPKMYWGARAILERESDQPGKALYLLHDRQSFERLDGSQRDEEFSEVLSNCYTGQDFIDECGGDAEMAERLFHYCDWQHPSSAIDELADDGEDS